MNTKILVAIVLILFDILGLFDWYQSVAVDILCFMFGLSFGYYVANLEKIRLLSTFFNYDVHHFIQSYNKNHNINILKFKIEFRIPKYTPPEERDFLTYLDDLQYQQTVKNPDQYFQNVKIINFDIINHECRGDPLSNPINQYFKVTHNIFFLIKIKMKRKW